MNTFHKIRDIFGLKALLGFLALLILILLILPPILTSKSKETIKIGAIIPLTGPSSRHSVFLDAINLAIDEINSSGGINKRKLELIVRDSRTDPDEGIKAFKDIEREHHPLLYISTTSVVSLALAPLAEENQVVLVGLAVSNPTFTEQKKWAFRYYTSAEDEVRPIIIILEKLAIGKLGVLYQDDAFGSSVHTAISESFKSAGGVITSESFDPTSYDFRAKTAALSGMEAIYIVGFVNVVGEAIKQLRADKYPGVILTPSGCASLPASMSEINGVYVAAPIIYNPNYIFARNAKEKYETTYREPFTHQAANGYDFMKIMIGLLDGQEASRENIRALLENEFSYPGIFGYIEKKAGQHDIRFPLYPSRIVDGEVLYLH